MCVCKMLLYVILVFAFFFNCASLEHVWHSYQHNPNHQNREELRITNITTDDQFKFNYVAKSWKSLCDDQICYLVGLLDKNVVISIVRLNEDKNQFWQKSQEINLGEQITDVAIFQNWNSSLQNSETIIVIAVITELLWYKLDETNSTLFWVWPIRKNITHINFFQMDFDNHLLIINQHLSQITADLYQIELKKSPNFWLRQKLPLSDFAHSSSVITSGPDFFLAIPQKSLNHLSIYKMSDNHFISYKNLTSGGITDVVAFTCGHKSFLAINGMNAGIYRLVKGNFLKESLSNSHFSGVNFWLPIHLSVYGDDFMLIAQRSLLHGGHKSFITEIITYNGDKFEEHDDIHCVYYGEEVLGLSCLPGEGGIEGSALMNIDNNLGLVVPRKNRSSDVFLFKIEIRQISNPLDQQLEEFIKRKSEINNLIKVQEGKYKELVAKSRQVFNLDSVKAKLDEMNANVLIMKQQFDASPTHYNSVTFNNVVEIKSNVTAEEVQVEEIGEELADTLLEDIVMRDNISAISSQKFFKNLETEDLLFDNVNGINSNQLFFATDNITIDGDLILEKPLCVLQDVATSNVNGAKFEDQVINLESPISQEIIFESVKTNKANVQKLNDQYIPSEAQINESGTFEFESLFIPQDITVEKVNGDDFNNFLHQLCLRNIRNYVPGLVKIEGDVTVERDAKIEYLNDLKFPLEYVFLDNTFPNITGVKTFNKLITPEVHCEGTINDINTSQFITLTTDQNLPETTTFKNLKITESLNVDGEIIGEHASKFLPNPTLLKTDFVTAKTHFKDLEVEGVIFLSENFNGKNFKSMLSDIVYSSEEEPFIDGLKTFPEGLTVRKNLIISSNTVNNINLAQIVTKNTDQVLNLSVLDGIVTFGNVEIGGLYNSVNITKLDEELVKVDGEQYISSTLIFEDELTVNELEAKIVRQKDRFFGSLDAENVVVEGNFQGEIQSFSLGEFSKNRMSFTEDQTVEGVSEIGHSFVTSVSAKKINDVNHDEFSSVSINQKLKSKILTGNLEITNLYAKSLEIDKIDNKSTVGLGGALDIKKHNLTNLSFNDDVHFESVEIENFGGVNFNKFVTNIVYKNETDVTFPHTKIFLKGFTVRKLIESQKINNVFLGNILRKYGVQEITGPVTVEGNVQFGENIIVNNINNTSIETITDFFQVNNNQIYLKGDVLFTRLPHIHNLHINSVQEFLDGIIYTDDNFKIQGQTTFENNANFEKNIRVIGKINSIDLPAFVSDMVMITKDASIKSSARFTKPTFIDHMIVNNNLKTHDLNKINLTSWMDDSIFVNKGFMKGKFIFENVTIVDNLQTDFINDININTLVPLRTHQNLTQLSFNAVNLFKDLPVDNSTNFHNLPNEFANTVLINTEQEIDSDVEFLGNVFIDNLELSSINRIETTRFVTTNTDQELTGIYHFTSKVNIGNDLIVQGLVNGINITEWDSEGVKISAPYVQNITNNWVIDQDLVLEDETTGFGSINSLNFKKFSHEIEEKRNYKYAMEKALVDDYTNICKDLTYMYERLQNQIYKFNYLENLQMLNFQNPIEHVFSFEHQNKVYLLISERKNCESHLFTFGEKFRFVQSLHFGLVSQIISVRLHNLFYLVIRNQAFYSTCKVQGTNLWQVIDEHFVHVANIEDQDLLQESLAPGIFYGISGNEITEFKVLSELDTLVTRTRKWKVDEDNLAFVPRGLATGLTLRTGRKLIRLHREDPIVEDFSYETEKIIRGNCTEEFNPFFPGRKGSDLVVMKVGIRSNKRSLLAVASHEETSVRGSLDFIKIYEDVFEGKMFHKVATYKPSSLLSLEFKSGETFLVFMEDQSVLQVYEYKGIEGFKHKLSSKIEGSKLITIGVSERRLIGVVDKNKLSFMEAVMLGNQIEENLHCTL